MRNLYRRKIKNRQKSPNIAILFFMIINADFSLFFPVITATSSAENTVSRPYFCANPEMPYWKSSFPIHQQILYYTPLPHSKSRFQTKKLVITLKMFQTCKIYLVSTRELLNLLEFFQTEFLFIFFQVISCLQNPIFLHGILKWNEMKCNFEMK